MWPHSPAAAGGRGAEEGILGEESGDEDGEEGEE